MLHTFCFRGNPERGVAKRTAQRRRRGAAEPRVEEHATAGSSTLGSRAECGFSPARHARQAKRGVSPSAESAAQQSPGRKPWEWHGIGESPPKELEFDVSPYIIISQMDMVIMEKQNTKRVPLMFGAPQWAGLLKGRHKQTASPLQGFPLTRAIPRACALGFAVPRFQRSG